MLFRSRASKTLHLLGRAEVLTKALLASAKECLSGSNTLLIKVLAKSGEALCHGSLLAIFLLSKVLKGLTALKPLTKKRAAETLHLLSRAEILTKALLAKRTHLLGRTKLLAIALLAERRKLLPELGLCGTVSLCSAKSHALLLLGGLEGSIICLLVQGRNGLSLCEALLSLQHSALQTGTVATKRTGFNGVRLLLRQLLTKLLLQATPRSLNNILGVGRHELLNIKRRSIYGLTASEGGLSGGGLECLASLKGCLSSPRGCALIGLSALKSRLCSQCCRVKIWRN